ncbi:hypothetical protein [Pseudorhodoferax sp. Leaf265]|uniref:hypothetical protein n=1 Tax=Pseudorhodoferax sp. Leaf265 TaxID=1736315 RepID=UPI0012E76239|nr:hypothetical protein [Pseudorhodoferax sp. Leaf265]
MSAWESILIAFGGNAAMMAVAGILCRWIFENALARDAKRFENELKAKSDVAIENLRSSLQLRTIEHQVRFSRLHERRAEVIAELSGHLAETLWEADSFLSPIEFAGDRDKRTKYADAMRKLVETARFFDKNRVYFPEALCERMEKLLHDIRAPMSQFGVWLNYSDEELDKEANQRKFDAWTKGFDRIRQDIPAARKALEVEFRALLGEVAAVG